MIKFKFKIPIYKWNVLYIEIEDKDDSNTLRNLFRKTLDISSDRLESIIDMVESGKMDGGEHFYNIDARSSILFYLPFSDINNRFEVMAHEISHLEYRIAEHLVLEGSECVAYLSGYIAEKIYPKVLSLINKQKL